MLKICYSWKRTRRIRTREDVSYLTDNIVREGGDTVNGDLSSRSLSSKWINKIQVQKPFELTLGCQRTPIPYCDEGYLIMSFDFVKNILLCKPISVNGAIM